MSSGRCYTEKAPNASGKCSVVIKRMIMCICTIARGSMKVEHAHKHAVGRACGRLSELLSYAWRAVYPSVLDTRSLSPWTQKDIIT